MQCSNLNQKNTGVLFAAWEWEFYYWCEILGARCSLESTETGVRGFQTVMNLTCSARIWFPIIVQLLGYRSCILRGLGMQNEYYVFRIKFTQKTKLLKVKPQQLS